MRRYQAECEEENALSLVSRGCDDPHSRVHFSPTHPHRNYSPAEQQTTSSNRSSLSHTSKSVRQLPDGRAETPTLGGLRSRTECAAAPARDAPWAAYQKSGQGGAGKKGESADVLSRLSWTRLRYAPTRPPELWSPLGPPA